MIQAENKPAPQNNIFSSRIKRVIGLVIVVGAIVAIINMTTNSQKKNGLQGAGAKGNTVVPIAAAAAVKGDIKIVVDALGTVTSSNSVTVKNQIAGVLTKIAFQEGQLVHEGDFLAEIDPRPYEVAVAQTEGQLFKDQALLKDAQVNLERDQQMVEDGAVSRQQLDTQAAAVQQYEGTVKTDQALVSAAKLNLAYCHITAPITGKVGLRQVDKGNYIAVGDSTGIVTITQMQPITVLFSIPETQVTMLMKRKKENAAFEVTALDRNMKTVLDTGKVASIDNQIDTATGTIKLRAIFNNTNEMLFPNQFVNIRLNLDVLKDAVVIPTTGLQRGSIGAYVYLIKEDQTVITRPVTIGPNDGEMVAITEGLAVGDKIVVDGVDKLRDGTKISLPAEKATAEKKTEKPLQKSEKPNQNDIKSSEPKTSVPTDIKIDDKQTEQKSLSHQHKNNNQ